MAAIISLSFAIFFLIRVINQMNGNFSPGVRFALLAFSCHHTALPFVMSPLFCMLYLDCVVSLVWNELDDKRVNKTQSLIRVRPIATANK